MPSERKFILKYDKQNIKAGTIVNAITFINEAVLIENKNKDTNWVMRYEIYPIEDYDSCGIWEYTKYDYEKFVKPYI